MTKEQIIEIIVPKLPQPPKEVLIKTKRDKFFTKDKIWQLGFMACQVETMANIDKLYKLGMK